MINPAKLLKIFNVVFKDIINIPKDAQFWLSLVMSNATYHGGIGNDQRSIMKQKIIKLTRSEFSKISQID